MKRILLLFLVHVICYHALAATEIVDGITWTYRIKDSFAYVGSGQLIGWGESAIPKDTSGIISVPMKLGGVEVLGVDRYAFHSCTNITSVNLPSSIQTIDDYAFYNAANLMTISLPDGVRLIGYNAFERTKLSSLKLPEGIQEIRDRAFAKTSLSEIEIPSGVQVLNEETFDGCTNLAKIILHEGLASFKNPIGYCPKLKAINIPASVSKISIGSNHGAYKYAESQLKLNINPNNPYYSSSDGVLYDKFGRSIIRCFWTTSSSTIKPTVTNITAGGYSSLRELESVVLPPNLEKLNANVFYDCKALTNVVLSSNLKEIGPGAFCDCTNLSQIELPEGVTNVGFSAFNRTGLTTITFPKSVVSVGLSALNSCSSLTKAYFEGRPPEGIAKICSNKSTATLYYNKRYSDEWQSIKSSLPFSAAISYTPENEMKTVEIDGVASKYEIGTVISINAPAPVETNGILVKYIGSSSQVSLAMHYDVEVTDDLVFNWDIAETNYYFSVKDASATWGEVPYMQLECEGGEPGTYLPYGTQLRISAVATNGAEFVRWTNTPGDQMENPKTVSVTAPILDLDICYIPPEFLVQENVLLRYHGKSKTVIIPQGVTEIADEVFLGKTNITSVVLPTTVTNVGVRAFMDCENIEAVTIKSQELILAQDSFRNCAKLNDVFLYGSGPYLCDKDAFCGCPEFRPHVSSAWTGGLMWDGRYVSEDCELFVGIQTNYVFVAVSNVVVHYVVNVDASVETKIVSEIKGGNISMPKEWTSDYYAAFSAKYDADLTKAFMMKSGKKDFNGREMYVWQDFVAGTDPTDVNDVFTASVTMVGGVPVISYSPELSEAEKAKRIYTTWGKAKLTDAEWTEVPSGSEADYNFFKVTVEMK